MNRKWFCELCKICVPYTKLDINDHIRTQKHQKNKTKDLDSKHMSAKMKNLTKEEKYQYQMKKQQEVGGAVEVGSMVDHFKNLSSQLNTNDFESKQKNFILKKQQEYLKSQGIQDDQLQQQIQQQQQQQQQQQKIVQPMEALSNSELVKHTLNNVWVLIKDDQTGKMCFFNKISKAKKFEKPFGLKISNEDQRIWEESQENQGVFPEFQPQEPEQIGTIGQWKETNEDFYEKYKAVSSQEEYEEDEVDQAQFIIFGDEQKTKLVNLKYQGYRRVDDEVPNEEQFKTDVIKKMVEQDFDLENNVKKVYQQITKRDEPPLFKKRKIEKKKLNLDD